MTQLPKGNTQLSRDTSTIVEILWANDEAVSVGSHRYTKIEAYDESGHMACIPWLACFMGDDIALRVPADQVAIRYLINKEPTT